jgi:electron transfer flavoprotein beta subunit
VTNLKIDGNKVLAQRDAEGDTENIESSLPILITAQQGLNEPRYPSLPGIMKAKKKSIDRYSLEDLGFSSEDTNSMLEYVDVYLPPKKGEVKLLEGDADEQVDQLIALFPNLLKLN